MLVWQHSGGLGIAFQPLQVGPHVRGVLVTKISVFLQSLIDDAFQFDGKSGFSRTADVGVPSRMALKITPELSPRNGNVPVAIS